MVKVSLCKRRFRLGLGIERMEWYNETSNNWKMKCNYGVN